jgi:hypothetical protein
MQIAWRSVGGFTVESIKYGNVRVRPLKVNIAFLNINIYKWFLTVFTYLMKILFKKLAFSILETLS